MKINELFEKENQEDPCWKGYKQVGMKTKNGKKVPRCVPDESQEESEEESNEESDEEDET